MARVFVIYFKEIFAYPAANIIWVIADAQASIVLPAVWLATSSPTIGGIPRESIVTYYACSMMISQVVTCHLMWDMGWDIREGAFSTQLIRPLNHFWLNVSRNVSWRLGKGLLFVPILGILMAVYGARTALHGFNFSAEFFVVLLLAHLLSFCAAYCMALITLWTTEHESILRLYYFPETLLSGRLLPVTALPAWAQSVGEWLPFQYMVYFPTQVLLGQKTGSQILYGVGMQLVWIVVLLCIARVLFVRGVRQYTGVGM